MDALPPWCMRPTHTGDVVMGRADQSAAGVAAPVRRGRRLSTTREKIADVALELFARNGFEETTVEEIAVAAGIGRRTFFRYFTSKNDVPWSDLSVRLDQMRIDLHASPRDEPIMEAIRKAVLTATDYSRADQPIIRQRIELIETVPALQSHSALVYAAWRRVIAEFVAERLGGDVEDLVPQTIAYATLAATMASTRWWIRHEGTDLAHHLDLALRYLANGFAQFEPIGGVD
jgi:mycofactocin system transcriptional regulator